MRTIKSNNYIAFGILAINMICIITSYCFSQSTRSLINDGNDLYKKQKFNEAEINYRKSIQKDKNLYEGYYNLGNSLYKQGNYGDALKEYKNSVGKTLDIEKNYKLFHNLGNTLIKNKQYKESIEAYKQALKINPSDIQTKYNLSYALKMLQQQQQQQQNNQNQNKQDQNKQQQQQNNQNQNQNKQDQNKQDQNKQQQQQQQQQKLSQQQADQILNALNNDEKKVREKLKKQFKSPNKNVDKDW